MSVEFRGLTERLVPVASIGVKVLHFDIDPRIALFLGNITDLGHPEVYQMTAMAETLVAAWQRYYQSVIECVKEKLRKIENILGDEEILSIAFCSNGI